MCVSESDPRIPLFTSIKLNVPIPVESGPVDVVPKPTFKTLTYSLSIFTILSVVKVVIPLNEIIFVDTPTLPILFSNACVISVLLIGDCATLSITINDFSFALNILNS